MTVITHGSVSVEDGIRKSDELAPARRVRVELHFDNADGDDVEAALDEVSRIANERVKMLLRSEK